LGFSEAFANLSERDMTYSLVCLICLYNTNTFSRLNLDIYALFLSLVFLTGAGAGDTPITKSLIKATSV